MNSDSRYLDEGFRIVHRGSGRFSNILKRTRMINVNHATYKSDLDSEVAKINLQTMAGK